MKKIKIIADNKIPFLKGVLESVAEIKYLPGSETTKIDVADADAIITRTRTKCDQQLLENSSVKIIATATIGFDHIDRHYCEANNIIWKNAPGCNSSSVMQYLTSALLYLAQKYDFRFKDKTIGIVGVGNVGSKVAKAAETLGMKVLLNDPPRAKKEGQTNFVSLEKIIAEAGIISFHVPLNKTGIDKTFHLVDTDFIEKLSEKAFIINTSRGEVIETNALKSGLKSQKLSGAVIDVWEHEPNIDKELLELVDIGTPHIAGYSADGKANGTAMSVQTISRIFNLGFDDWYPTEIPKPQNPIIEISNLNNRNERILNDIVKSTYNIINDSDTLLNSPQTFEKQRGDYYIRREFPAYTVKLLNSNEELKVIIEKLGFTIQ